MKDGAATSCRVGAVNAIADARLHVITCTATNTTQWDVTLYIDGEVSSSASTNAATGTITNSVPIRIARAAQGVHRALDGIVMEARVHDAVTDAPTALARYIRAMSTGKYWNDGTPLVHYKFNEFTVTDGVGLRDHSGNAGHLTVVSPDPTTKRLPKQ